MMDHAGIPEDPQTKASRREPRLPCNPTGIHAYVEGRGRPVAGQIVEVSRTGIRLQIDEAVPIGSVMTVEVGGTLLMGDVRHCEPHDEQFAVGLQTLDVRHR
jgi:hypothetical protein